MNKTAAYFRTPLDPIKNPNNNQKKPHVERTYGQRPSAADGWVFPESVPKDILETALMGTDEGKQFIFYDAKGQFSTKKSAVYAVVKSFPVVDFEAHNKYPSCFPSVFKQGDLTIMQWFPDSHTVSFILHPKTKRYELSAFLTQKIRALAVDKKDVLKKSLMEIGDLKESFLDLQFILDWPTGRAMLIDPQGMRLAGLSLFDQDLRFLGFYRCVLSL